MWKRKISIKEQYKTLGHFLRGDEPCHYIGQRYIEGTNIYARREWRGVRDTAYAFGFWLMTWVKMGGLVLRDPVRMARAFWTYRWLTAYLVSPSMIDKWIEGDRGIALRADLTAINCMISDSIETLWTELRADRRFGETKWTDITVAFDYTLPKHLIFGFPGCYAVNMQQHAAFMLPLMRKDLGCYYVDQAVSCGIPGDMCTLPLTEVGVAVEGEYPDIGNFWMTTNNPCDANMMDNAAMYRALSSNGKKAVHPLNSPLMYDDPTTKELGVHEIKEAIKFMEQQFNRPFDWEAFIRHCELTNQVNREEMERWDIYCKTSNGCLNAICQGMYRIYFYQQGGTKYFSESSKKTLKLFYRSVEKNLNPFPNTRHRALAWSCGSTYYCHGVGWLYNCWGILAVINMDSLTGHNLIDTEDRETMLEDLADWYSHTPMRTHTVGGNRHLMQMWETAEKFNCDTIIMYDDIGCKGMAGAQGLLEEEFNKHRDRFNIIWMPHSLMDCRIVPTNEARKAVNQYMTSVLHEEPVDPTLVDFDDTLGW
ncbi:MAG: 2-hydroxyacyl-CoA dehydratase family protein [Candidatus Limivicinus sp.]|nr:2-hydroxyacyl-CoA dehydratase family protein [Clostridiales bacterium]MDY3859923.1 2-hydroxyacyl-CoA dehydratase family protein [Candidatus Limivicinus sp.]